jgi:NADH-quinone oxidoreductase subunit K
MAVGVDHHSPSTIAISHQPSAIDTVFDMITPTHYMLLSAALFIIGVIGVMVRRNIIIIFMSIELILNAVNINLVAYSAQLQNAVGQVFAIFVIAVAAAEAAVGLGIILAFYRNKETVNIDEMNLMRW